VGGIKFELNTEVDKYIKIQELIDGYDAVFLACGTMKERPAGIKGEELLLSGVKLLRNSNQQDFKIPGAKVAVLGGGNVALDVARTLRRLGAEPLIVYRRSREEMPAMKEEVDKAEQEGIQIKFLTLQVEASKKDEKILLQCIRMRLGPIDETGRPRPIPIQGSEFTNEFDAVIKAIGEEPDTSIVPDRFLKQLTRLKTDTSRHVLGGNIFAGGDFVTGPSTVGTAISGGRAGADSIDQYLGGKGIQDAEIEEQAKNIARKFNTSFLKKTSRANAPELPVSERIKSITVEDTGSLELSAVESEANRCLDCSCVAVNSSDLAPALIAMEAKIKTTKRVVSAGEFFAVNGNNTTILKDDEIVTEIQVPLPNVHTKSKFIKFAIRKSIDFPVVNCAAAIEAEHGTVKKARICLNSVYGKPYRVDSAEQYLSDKTIDESTAERAADTIVENTCPLADNSYKIQIARTLVKRVLLACSSSDPVEKNR